METKDKRYTLLDNRCKSLFSIHRKQVTRTRKGERATFQRGKERKGIDREVEKIGWKIAKDWWWSKRSKGRYEQLRKCHRREV